MAIKLPLFDRSIRVVTPDFKPTPTFHQWWQRVVRAIEAALAALEDSVTAIEAALEAAGIALDAAEAAQTAADSVNSVAKLTNSGCIGLTLSATDAGTDASIVISAHTRVYGDGTQVAVAGTTLTGRAYTTGYYVYYDDPQFDGLGITYQTTTSEVTAAQTGNRHLVGAVMTPTAGAPDEDGNNVRPPGLDNLPSY